MKKRVSKSVILASLLLAVTTSRVTADDDNGGPKFGPWSAPVNLGPPVNTVGTDYQPFISNDGLSLYFTRLEGNVQGGPQDIWVAKRSSESDSWGEPQRLGPGVNSAATEGNPFVTVDGHWMYFSSNRKTADANGVLPFGGNDIYVSHRQNKREDFGPGGWQEPVNAGFGVNSSSGETGPFVFEDDATGVTTLYFTRNVGPATDIYASTLQPDGTFDMAHPVVEINSTDNDQHPSISRDGLEMYFLSDRPGSIPYPLDNCCGPAGQPSLDIWVSKRASTSDAWGTPVNLDAANQSLGGSAINSPFFDGGPSLSFDGLALYFFSAHRQGSQSPFFDIWFSTRAKLKGANQE